MMSAISIFGENSFIFNFVGYGLVIKSLRAGAHLKRRERIKNVKRWMWIFLQPNYDESPHLDSRG